MTGRTHDLAAFVFLSYIVATNPIPEMRLSTLMVAVMANLVGGLTPDIDQSTADLWHKFPAGSLVGKMFAPLLGGHRYISHSLIGVAFFGIVSKLLLIKIGTVLLVNIDIVWWAFMIGFLSHLIMDTFTTEGVPWLFPIPFRFGIPPFKFLRIKTGGLIEKLIVFPGLLVAAGYIYSSHYATFLTILRHYIK